MHRREFLQTTAAVPLLARKWTSAPPAKYLAELSTLMRAAPVPGAVIGAIGNRDVVWIAPLGICTPASGKTVTSTTLFHVASLTKQVTAYAAFALRAQGKLDFDRPLVSYVDDLPNELARKVTIRHVLSHSSGFPNWRWVEASKPIPDLAPAFAPGSRYQYSGEGFFYLQRVMERVTGHGIGQLVHELVFQPLGMTSSSLVWNPATLERTALPHNRRGEIRKDWDRGSRAIYAYAAKIGKLVVELQYADYAEATREAGAPILPDNMQPNAASSLVTSAEDYARFLRAAIQDREIAQEQVSINEFLGWGLGWAIERFASHTYVWQWGDNPGFKNFVLAEPSTKSAVFVFTNGDAGARVYDRVVTRATGHDHPALFWL